MRVFRQATSVLEATLLDEGRPTDLRITAAGAVAAPVLAPQAVRRDPRPRSPKRRSSSLTTTLSTEPLLHAHELRPGAHITAIGSDAPDKRELAGDVLARADVVADRLEQCRSRGEIGRALADGTLEDGVVVELGAVEAIAE